MTDRWQQINRIYDAALEVAEEARPAFLESICQGDEELRREVESLLAYDKQAQQFIDRPALQLTAEKLADEPPSLLGRQLGPYQIQGVLGAGGMGEVYKARDTRLNRIVAIKALPRHLSERADLRHRLEREARAIAGLNHPNICALHDIGRQDEVDFLVMEYLQGETLRERLKRGALPTQEVLRYAVEIAGALDKAHRQGIIHRDLKPGNIMLTETGSKLLDFGLAKQSGSLPPDGERSLIADGPPGSKSRSLTEEGMILGTLEYMAPEQLEGKDVDARTDVFALGILIYEMATGRKAFEGESKASLIAAILTSQPPSITTIQPLSPPELETAVRRCLNKNAEERWQRVQDLLPELRGISARIVDRPVLTAKQPTVPTSPIAGERAGALLLKPKPPVTSQSSQSSWTGKTKLSRDLFRIQSWAPLRHKGWLVPATGLFFTVLAILAIWLVRRSNTSASKRGSVNLIPLTTYAGIERHPAFSPDATQVAFSWQKEEQRDSDIYVKVVGTESLVRLTNHPANEYSPAWSPDGRRIAFLRSLGGDRSVLVLIPALGGPERLMAEVNYWYPEDQDVDWHPTGNWLVLPNQEKRGEPAGLFLISAETGEIQRLTSPPARALGDRNPTFSPDGLSLAFSRSFTGSVANLFLVSLSSDLAPRDGAKQLTVANKKTFDPAWTADGREIIFASGPKNRPNLWRTVVSKPDAIERIPFAEVGAIDPTISRRGDRLAYTQVINDVNIWRLDLSSSDTRTHSSRSLISSTRLDHMPEISPDGQRIAFESDRSGNREIWVCNSDGSESSQVTSIGEASTGSPRWSPDGQHIVFTSNLEGSHDVYVVDSHGGKPARLTTDSASEFSASYSRKGKWIYFGSNRSGALEVRKIPAGGGSPVQLTHAGGCAALESTNGDIVFYTKDLERVSSLWKVSADGGEETRVLGSVYGQNFVVVSGGIYFIPEAGSDRNYSINFMNFRTGTVRAIAPIAKEPMWGLSVSPDERWLLFTQLDNYGSDLMLLEGFR